MLVDSGLNCTVGATVPRGQEEGAFHTKDWTNPKSFRAQEVDHVAMALAAGAPTRIRSRRHCTLEADNVSCIGDGECS
ncbi:unnamed protein product [Phytophthora lilii]|uniref:Unnamed protein product n=1 Tax=Phytophthora lilii TaxID=2077276 RepID=A0A9W6WPR9_9STRA|nr:unnamed protein product [Phytophthora lilii]